MSNHPNDVAPPGGMGHHPAEWQKQYWGAGRCWELLFIRREDYRHLPYRVRRLSRVLRYTAFVHACEHFGAPNPDQFVLKHICGNRYCSNPEHIKRGRLRLTYILKYLWKCL